MRIITVRKIFYLAIGEDTSREVQSANKGVLIILGLTIGKFVVEMTSQSRCSIAVTDRRPPVI
jgi:hypothetical protein